MEWIPEKVLQRYVVKNFQKFQEEFQNRFNSKINYARHNKPIDKYPDIYFVLEDKQEIPIEVEWKTSNFDHDPQILLEQNGYIFVGIIKPDIDVGSIKQIQIDLKDFEKWFERNSKKLVEETTKSLHEIDEERQLPKLWFTYLGQKGDAIKHFEPALIHGIWGVQKNYNPTTKNQISDVKKEDLIAFIIHGKMFNGRIPLDEWNKKSFKGYFEKIYVFRVTKTYFKDDSKIWKTNQNSKWKDELFPHRFGFNNNPLLIMKNIKINQLGLTSKRELHNTTFTNFRKCEPHTLVDIMHNAEQLSLKEYQKELEHISGLT